MTSTIMLAGAKRTAIGSYCGIFSECPTPTLGATCIKATLQESGIPAHAVEEIFLGTVIGAGLGQNPARQAVFAAGLNASVEATTVNKVCGSGLKAVMLASQTIETGNASVVIAGGMENMSRVPYLLERARTGYRMGDGVMIDAMIRDGLWDVYNNVHMGTYGDRTAEKCGFDRKAQDDFAIASYKRAFAARDAGVTAREIAAVEAPQRRNTVSVTEDEELERFDEDKMRTLRPAFEREGTVTAGNASSINDGAATIAVLSEKSAEALNVQAQARVVAFAGSSREPEWFTLAPIGSIQAVLEKAGWTKDEVDLYEINEAFSVVPMAAMKELGLPHEKVNIHGGAVALGHPIGASGCRILVTLIHALKETGGKKGLASLCIGGGEAVAMAIELI